MHVKSKFEKETRACLKIPEPVGLTCEAVYQYC